MATTLTEVEATAAVAPFGFKARAEANGFFIAPVTRNRFGLPHVGDDAMLIRADGTITPYAHDAQAFLAAKALAHRLATPTA